MDKKMMVIAVLAVAIVGGSAYIITDESESDAAQTTSITWKVGEQVSQSVASGYYRETSGSVPGITFSQHGTVTPIVRAEGSPTTPGNYTVNIYGPVGTITRVLDITVVQAYTITFTASPSNGGTISETSISVSSGTRFTASGNTITFGETTVTATAQSGYAFSSWSPSSGTVNSNRTITANFSETNLLTVTFRASSGGSVSPSTVLVPYGTTIYTPFSTTITAGSTTVTATPSSGYVFTGWSGITERHTIYSNTIIDAYFTRPSGTFTWEVGDTIEGEPIYTIGSTSVSIKSGSVPGLTISEAVMDRIKTFFAYGTPTTAGEYVIVFSDANAVKIIINPGGTTTRYTLTFTSSPSNGGTTSQSSVTLDSGTTYRTVGNRMIFTTGSSSHAVEATPNTGYEFSRWSPSSGTISSNTTFTAYFDQVTTTYLVSFSIYPSGSGSVSPSSMRVTYGTSYTVSSDRTVLTIGGTTIQTTPNSGYAFNSWGVMASGTITSDTTFPANFTSATHTVTIVASPSEGGTITPTTITVAHGTTYYGAGDQMTVGTTNLVVTPAEGYSFSSWSSYSGTVVSDMTLTGYFGREYCTVYFDATPSAGGSVSIRNLQVDSGTTFTTDGNTLTINGTTVVATANNNFEFDSWSSASGTITRNPTIIRANFSSTVQCTVSFEASPEGSGEISQTSITVPYYTTLHVDGNTITIEETVITATPTADLQFKRWSVNTTIITHDMTVIAYFDKDFQVTVEYSTKATLRVNGETMEETTTYTVSMDNRPILECVPGSGYTFVYYEYTSYSGGEVQDTNNPIALPLADTRVKVVLTTQSEYTVTFLASEGGIVSPTTASIPAGSKFRVIQDGILVCSRNDVRVVPTPNEGYVFKSWSENVNDIVVSNMTITASFEKSLEGMVWWFNGYANNKVTLVFDFESKQSNYKHLVSIPLQSYNAQLDNTTPKYFEDSGYRLDIELSYNQTIKTELSYNGVDKYESTYKPGIWQRYALILDLQSSKITFQGISSALRNPTSDFNFMNYDPLTNTVIADWSNITSDKALSKIYHADMGSGRNHVRFQANATSTFLDTYGFVMIDPRINIGDYFPDYDDIRLNLYSFALYGDSITFNNQRFTMDGSQITIRYDERIDSSGGRHYIATPSGSKSFTTTLTNVYITWENLHSDNPTERQCYLTFVDDKRTFEMGIFAKGDLWISGAGMWYFTTAVWSPYTTTENHYTMDWNSPFNISADGFILIFIAIAILVLVAMNVIWKPTFLDYVVVIGGCIIAYMMLGFIW